MGLDWDKGIDSSNIMELKTAWAWVSKSLIDDTVLVRYMHHGQ